MCIYTIRHAVRINAAHLDDNVEFVYFRQLRHLLQPSLPPSRNGCSHHRATCFLHVSRRGQMDGLTEVP